VEDGASTSRTRWLMGELLYDGKVGWVLTGGSSIIVMMGTKEGMGVVVVQLVVEGKKWEWHHVMWGSMVDLDGDSECIFL
jgi:hypothetical protein